MLVTGEIIRKVMTKTDLPYNSAGHLGPAGDSEKLSEKLWRKQICHTILLVAWDLLVTRGNYSKSYDENRSTIQYCWLPRTCWWLAEIIRKVMTKTDLPYDTAGHLGPSGDWGNYSKSYDENRSSIQYCWSLGTCWWLRKLLEKLWRKQIFHTILLVTWDLLSDLSDATHDSLQSVLKLVC
jgi:hypothetical protein